MRRRRLGPAALAVGALVGALAGVGTGAVVVPAGGGPSSGAALLADPRSPDEVGSEDAGGTADTGTELPTAEPAVPPTLEPVDLLPPEDRAAGLTSREVPRSADGELVVVPGDEAAPHPDRAVRRVRVEVESGLPVDGARFAETVMRTLNDERGWGADGSVTFARTDGDADIRVVLASPDTVDAMCAPLRTRGLYSCGRYGHAAINHTRWVEATDEFEDLTTYRRYVVNHEVGHLLGHQHVRCPGAGELAPVMQQQTIQVAPCLPNAWPNP